MLTRKPTEDLFGERKGRNGREGGSEMRLKVNKTVFEKCRRLAPKRKVWKRREESPKPSPEGVEKNKNQKAQSHFRTLVAALDKNSKVVKTQLFLI